MKLSSLFALTPIAFALSVNAQTTQNDTVEVKEIYTLKDIKLNK